MRTVLQEVRKHWGGMQPLYGRLEALELLRKYDIPSGCNTQISIHTTPSARQALR